MGGTGPGKESALANVLGDFVMVTPAIIPAIDAMMTTKALMAKMTRETLGLQQATKRREEEQREKHSMSV